MIYKLLKHTIKDGITNKNLDKEDMQENKVYFSNDELERLPVFGNVFRKIFSRGK